ncbi:MAG: dihydroorotate oxidase [Clostridiales bacterium GWF2_38_85]|nr:MAG: dihydroorotate oxidase [Clostridiales bacterium GWF2_38_85]HBL83708.1 dihydroorotate dehydrogenase electron transfer subunit [Clostridiales bacterium]
MSHNHKEDIYTLTENRLIAKNTYRTVFEGYTGHITKPGQFVNIKVEGQFLRRPISVCDYNENNMVLIYKIIGQGTKAMSEAMPGTRFDILTGLGNGYTIRGNKPLLIGGGVGVPPIYCLAKALASDNIKASVIIGFNSVEEVFYYDEFKALGCNVIVTTADGSMGLKGFVTDAIDRFEYDYFYTCGPEPMLKAVYNKTVTEGQLSFEERMGCGFGACMGCSCETKYGSKRICLVGPVLEKNEVIW